MLADINSRISYMTKVILENPGLSRPEVESGKIILPIQTKEMLKETEEILESAEERKLAVSIILFIKLKYQSA